MWVGMACVLADLYDIGLLGEQSTQKCEIPCLGRRWTANKNVTRDGATGTHLIKLLTTQFINPKRMKGWVGLGWLVAYQDKVPPPGVEPGHITHPSTNRDRHRVTSLIRPTPLPLRHATTHVFYYIQSAVLVFSHLVFVMVWCYANAVYAVCLSICPSQVSILSKLLNTEHVSSATR